MQHCVPAYMYMCTRKACSPPSWVPGINWERKCLYVCKIQVGLWMPILSTLKNIQLHLQVTVVTSPSLIFQMALGSWLVHRYSTPVFHWVSLANLTAARDLVFALYVCVFLWLMGLLCARYSICNGIQYVLSQCSIECFSLHIEQ